MKNSTIRLMITLLSIVCGVETMCADRPEANLRLQLKNMPTTRPAAATVPALEAIDPRVELATVQSAAAGLRLTVVLINRGAEPVRLLDPEELTSIVLLDEEGWPIQVPRAIPRGLDDRRRRPDEPDDAQKIVTLAPGSEHRVTITVTHVLSRAQKGEEPKSQPIRAGTYKVRVITNLAAAVPAGEPVQTRMVSTAEPFTVHLGV